MRYEQLADELSRMIVGRILRPGERLPSVRRLSQEKKLSISTVLQALRELEARGQVEARPQSEFFVCLPPSNQSLKLKPQTGHGLARPVAVNISSRLEGVLALSNRSEMAPLGAALPAIELLPVAHLQRL